VNVVKSRLAYDRRRDPGERKSVVAEDDELTCRLADRYEVSLQATAIRLGNLHLQD
jgi:hypothetical protein